MLSTSGPVPAAWARVLVVEDQDSVRRLVTAVLERHGLAVCAVASAEDALDVLDGDRFDLLLTDVMLGGMSGAELARQVRASEPQMRVLLMSGYTGDIALDDADLEDARGFIQKPFSSAALLARVRALLGEAGLAARTA